MRVRTYWLTLLSLAITLTLLLPPVYVGVDGLLRVPNLSRLLAHSPTLVASWSVQAFFSYLNYPEIEAPPCRPPQRLGVACGPSPHDGLLRPRARRRGGAGFHDALWKCSVRAGIPLGLVYLGFALVNVVPLSRRYANIASRTAMDLGLRVVAGGAVVGLGYVAHEAGRLVTT